MKTILITLLLTALSLRAQAPASSPNSGTFAPVPVDNLPDTNRDAQLRQALQNALAGKATGVIDQRPANSPTNIVLPGALPAPGPSTRTALTPLPPSAATNSSAAPVISPAPAPAVSSQPEHPGDFTATNLPPIAAANTPPEEMLPAGTINFPATDLNQVLQIYSELVGRTILRPTTLPAPTITLKTQTPLTRREAIQAFDAVLALNGVAVVNVGEKFVKVIPTAQAGQVGAAFSKEKVDQLPDLGQFVTGDHPSDQRQAYRVDTGSDSICQRRTGQWNSSH